MLNQATIFLQFFFHNSGPGKVEKVNSSIYVVAWIHSMDVTCYCCNGFHCSKAGLGIYSNMF